MNHTLKIETVPSGKTAVWIPVQSPDLCDLQDEYGYHTYRDDYRDEITGCSGLSYAFDEDVDRLARFISEAQPIVNSIYDYFEREEQERRDYEQAKREQFDRERIAHAERVSRDAENIKNIGDFTGGGKIIMTIPTREYDDDLSDEWWIGKTGTCWSREDVSPNAIRRGVRPHYYIGNDCEPIGGNSNPSITQYFGWRGTTNDISIHAHGVRMVEKIVQFNNHARIYISKFNPEYID